MNSSVRALSRTPCAWRCFTHRGIGPVLLSRPSRRSLVSAAELQFGQPLYETHPHLLRAGELTPGITAIEYAERRARLAQALPPNSLAILAAADVKYRSGSVFYRFHQEPNFYYLTGFNEPDALAVIEKPSSGREHIFHLYVRPKDPRDEKWEGSRSGVQAARDVFNADEVGDIRHVLSTLPSLIRKADEVFTDIPTTIRDRSTFSRIFFNSGSLKAGNIGEALQKSSVKPLMNMMNELRVFKSEAEIKNMRTAGRASGTAFNEAMRQPFKTERELEAFFDYRFKANGCEETAYVPVVAGGYHGTQIHYVRNDDVLDPDELVTVDAGGEYGGYVTDITRAWPVNGKFSPAQKDLYEIILAVQRKCVSLCRENANLSLDQLHNIAEDGLKQGLKALGFDIPQGGFEALFPHHLGHYLGLAVHDAPGHSRTRKLKAGQVITVEPGIYVEKDDDRWPKHFRGMGIRIEDSVCIQEEGPLVLTVEAVKEVVDIEALRR